MRARKRGRIVNVSSIGGLIGVPHLLPYAASKFALTGLSEGLHAELAREGIVVTTVCPGLMRTGSPRHAWFKGDHAAEYRWFAAADSLPLLSMSAERAAARIFDALSAGEAFVILGLPAKLAARVHGIAPGLVDRALALANRWLPRPTIAGLEARAGAECAPDAPGPLFRAIVAPSVRAEGRLNER
jgi:short-subunit dehydrogenase